MAFFSKRRSAAAPVPQVCHRCRVRMGTIHVHRLAGPDPAVEAKDDEWWLCSECAGALRPDDPSSS